MRILALEPYYGGSHRAFIDGWISRSRHDWTLLHLPPYKWKWRMRHSALTFAGLAKSEMEKGHSWDAVFCSDMLNLAEFSGLVPQQTASLPAVAYFHENQLSYPVRYPDERDYHFAAVNMTTAVRADTVWFNSEYHRTQFLTDLEVFLKKMPDYRPIDCIESIAKKSAIQPPAIEAIPETQKKAATPPAILWAARWEFDKGPETFFAALKRLSDEEFDFRLHVIGEQFGNTPAIFEKARDDLQRHIGIWGYRESRDTYIDTLRQSDIIVSSAEHEFFGLSVLEAAAAGAVPVVPDRLSYPEILDCGAVPEHQRLLYPGDVESLCRAIRKTAAVISDEQRNETLRKSIRTTVERFFWENRINPLDDGIEDAAEKTK